LLNPGNAIAYTNRADAYDDKGDFEQAIAGYDEALRLNPRYVAALNNRGRAYLQQKKIRERRRRLRARAAARAGFPPDPQAAGTRPSGGTIRHARRLPQIVFAVLWPHRRIGNLDRASCYIGTTESYAHFSSQPAAR